MLEAGSTAIVISASSDIGEALCRRWSARGVRVFGTYRARSAGVKGLEDSGTRLFRCDLSDAASTASGCAELSNAAPEWDALVLCAGDLNPVGPFVEADFDDWARSLAVNFTSQLRVVRELLPARRRGGALGPAVLFFAGGGTNGATLNYSAYTVSKIALIKMCELLDAELPEVRFSIVGPGWVKTKIHDQTLAAGSRAGESLRLTRERLESGEFVPMSKVLDCCDWVVSSPREVVGGRNFSAAGDDWGAPALAARLRSDASMFKLRRAGNTAGAGGG